MNIALFTDCYFPTKNGVVTVVQQLRESLEKDGHHVVIVTTKPANYDETDENIYRATNSISMGLGNVKDQYLGIVWWPKLKKFLKKHKVEIIHCHTELTVGIMGGYAARRLNIPCVFTTHTMWEDYIRNYVSLIDKLIPMSVGFTYIRNIYKHFDCMIGVSQKVSNFNKKKNIAEKIPNVVIHNALDPKKIMSTDTAEELNTEAHNLRHNLGIKDDETMILYVGRIAIEKRSLELFNSLVPVLREDSKSKVVFVGDGPIFDQLKKTSALVGFDDRFIFTGFVDWKNVGKYYNAADMFVTASITECCPMTVIEAFLGSTPVICRKDDSYSFSVIEGVTGYQAETDEILTEKILELCQNKDLQKKLGQNAKEKSRDFMPEVFVHRHEFLYSTLIKNRKIKDPELLQRELDSIVE